jgi:hypothetical protein
MPPPETGKQRATRIPLDYFKRLNSLEKGKLWLALVALLAAAGWWASGFLRGDNGKLRYSRGPVASVHAAWDAKCEACHVDFSPMSGQNVLTSLGGRPAGHGSAADARCETCHAGPPHHLKQQLPDKTPSCGGCHREHQGRDFSLVRLADSDCTRCHGDLQANSLDPEQVTFARTVTDFARDHPEFRSVKEDTGKLKFNHKIHLAPGQVITPGQERPFTLGRITDPTERTRYANRQDKKEDSDLVQLDCRSCHQLDSGDFGFERGKPEGMLAAAAPGRATGAYFLPIKYENHCKACHPLTFDKQVVGKDNAPLAVPHRLQPDEVNKFLWGAYADYYKSKQYPDLDQRIKEWLAETPNPMRPLPGKLTREEEEKARSEIVKGVNAARVFLYQNKVAKADRFLVSGKTSCGECHHIELGDGQASQRIVQPAVKDVWFEHARFNHASHKALDCRACHDKAYASESEKDVLVPGIANCRQCHAPADHANGQAVGGARHDCTECHNYHHGDSPMQGLGAWSRDPHRKGDVRWFLDGGQ